MGPLTLEVVMPRVRKDGACAQFRPSQPEESMVQLYKAGRVEHMFVLKGTNPTRNPTPTRTPTPTPTPNQVRA